MKKLLLIIFTFTLFSSHSAQINYEHVGSLYDFWQPSNFRVNGDYAYFSINNYDEINIYNISDPNNITFVKKWKIGDTFGTVYGLSTETNKIIWAKLGTGIIEYPILAANGKIYFCREGVEEKVEIPTTYSLSQNYPNPFNPSTTITYALPKSGFVILKVYDVLGNEVNRLVNRNETAEIHSVSFDASKLGSGVYF